MSASYNNAFMEYAADSSAYAAKQIVSLLGPLLRPSSVLDVGCALGAWLYAWENHGVEDIHGVDGSYVELSKLKISPEKFTPTDLSQPFQLGRTFDYVQSLEVAEHIENNCSSAFINSICQHADKYVLFSAAPPGQGGEHHINEQSYDFWREKFTEHGFEVFDFLRGQIADEKKISYWYRYNVFLYVRSEIVSSVPSAIGETYVTRQQPLSDVSPLSFRLRKATVRALPYRLRHQIARLKSHLMPTGRI